MQDNTINLSKTNKKYFIWSAVLLGAFIFCYAKAITDLIMFWRNSYIYSYGFLIPCISAYIIWSDRDKFKSKKPAPSYLSGFLIILSGTLMFIVGFRSGIFVIESFSIIVTVAGIVILLSGKQFFSILWFPIAYLLFMVPIWDTFTEKLQSPFQNFSAFTADKLLKLIGIPVYRESVYIELPNLTLEVAKVCSGINNLIAVVAIAIPLAYITLKSWKKRFILIIGGVAIAALFNGFRVAIIGLMAYNGISEVLHGPGHILQAMSVSIFGFIVLFTGAWILSRDKSESSPVSRNESQQCNPLYTFQTINLKNYLMFLIIATLVLTGAYINFYRLSPVPLKMSLNSFPDEIGEYKAEAISPDHDVFKTSEIDSELSRSYRTASGKKVRLYIGYFEAQKQGRELVNYQTAKFHDEASMVKIMLTPDETIEVNKKVINEKSKKELICFWYDFNGHVVANRYRAKIYTILDALIKGRTNGALIMVISDLEGAETKEISKDIEEFIRRLLPIIHNYLPS